MSRVATPPDGGTPPPARRPTVPSWSELEPAPRRWPQLRPWRWSRRRQVLAAVVAAALLLVGVNTGFELAGRRDDGSGLAPGVRDAAVQRLLDVRARAVTAHDETAWMSVVATADPTFVRAQRAQFRGLERVPFQTFGYRALPGRSYTVPATTRRWGRSATVAAVVETHRLRGFDVGDVAEPAAFTVAQVHGAWRLVSDSDADRYLPEGGHADPWDLGEVRVATGAHSLVVGPAADAAGLPALARAVDAAVEADERVWPAGAGTWPGRVVVYAARDSATMTRLLRQDQQADPAETSRPYAVTTPVTDAFTWFDELSEPPQVVGSRVVVDDAAADVDAETLRHEIAHVATQLQERPGTPTWMVEGIAEWTALQPHDLAEVLDVDDVPADLEAGPGRFRLPSSVDFYDGDDTAVADRYAAATLACTYVAQRYGRAALLQLHARLSDAPDEVDEPGTTARALRDVLHVSTDRFQDDLAAWVAAGLR